MSKFVAVRWFMLQYAAVGCSWLQCGMLCVAVCVAVGCSGLCVCCSRLQCIWQSLNRMRQALRKSSQTGSQDERIDVLQCVAVRCSMLQCVAVCWGV